MRSHSEGAHPIKRVVRGKEFVERRNYHKTSLEVLEMKRSMIMVTSISVILFASVIYFLRGLALALLGGVTIKIGAQAGGGLTSLAGVLMVASAVCAWVFVKVVWNFKPRTRAFGFVAADLTLMSVMFNFAQGATLNTEIVSIIVAVCIMSYSVVYGTHLRVIRRHYQPVASYEHS
jgi:hypothetical protein